MVERMEELFDACHCGYFHRCASNGPAVSISALSRFSCRIVVAMCTTGCSATAHVDHTRSSPSSVPKTVTSRSLRITSTSRCKLQRKRTRLSTSSGLVFSSLLPRPARPRNSSTTRTATTSSTNCQCECKFHRLRTSAPPITSRKATLLRHSGKSGCATRRCASNGNMIVLFSRDPTQTIKMWQIQLNQHRTAHPSRQVRGLWKWGQKKRLAVVWEPNFGALRRVAHHRANQKSSTPKTDQVAKSKDFC